MYKFVFTAAICLCCSLLAHAQSQPPATLEQGTYPYLVLSQVSNVASTTSLTDAQKVSLAEFFSQEQTAITDAVTNDMPPAALEQLKVQLAVKFQSILTAQQLAEYSTKRPGSYLTKSAAPLKGSGQ